MYTLFNPRVVEPSDNLKYYMYIHIFIGFSKSLWLERDPESHFSDIFYIGLLLLNKIDFNKSVV